MSINSGRAADATGVSALHLQPPRNSLYIDFSRQMYPRGGIRVNGLPTYDEEAITGAMGTSLPILRDVARSATLSFSYSQQLAEHERASRALMI